MTPEVLDRPALLDHGCPEVDSAASDESSISQRVALFSRAGWTDDQIADALQLTPGMVSFWRSIGQVPLSMVPALLYQRAKGGTRTVQRHGITVTEHVPPDTHACMLWLKNRAPDQWCDRPDQSGLG